MQLDAALLQPNAVSGAGTFEFLAKLDGAELRPARWDNRIAVLPITADDRYRFIIRDPVQLDAATPRMRAWVGLAAADGEGYVATRSRPPAPNGGRAGNESSIAAVAVGGRYLGRPSYTPPPPLAAVAGAGDARTDRRLPSTIALDLDALLSAIPSLRAIALPWSG